MRWGERVVIRRPVAPLTASIRVLALDQRVASSRTISITRTVTIRPLTFAAKRPPTWTSFSFKGQLR
jgi:hypothetical protein